MHHPNVSRHQRVFAWSALPPQIVQLLACLPHTQSCAHTVAHNNTSNTSLPCDNTPEIRTSHLARATNSKELHDKCRHLKMTLLLRRPTHSKASILIARRGRLKIATREVIRSWLQTQHGSGTPLLLVICSEITISPCSISFDPACSRRKKKGWIRLSMLFRQCRNQTLVPGKQESCCVCGNNGPFKTIADTSFVFPSPCSQSERGIH